MLGARRYRTEGNFGWGKLWRICYKNVFGKINFGEFIHFSKQKILPYKNDINAGVAQEGD